MGNLICYDGESRPPPSCRSFSPNQDFDSSLEQSEDEDYDIRSFISGRSPIPREPRVHAQKKTSHPLILIQQPGSWPSYALQDSPKNVLQGRGTPGETPKSLDQTSSLSDVPIKYSRKTNALLVVTDDDVKKQIKEIMQPYMLKRAEKIVDRAVEDMFLKVNTAEQHSCGSSQWVHKSPKANSTTSSGDCIHLDQVNKDVEFGKVATMKSHASTANGSSKPPYEPIVIKVCSQELSRSPEDFETKSPTSKQCVPSIKLAQVPSLELDSSKIKHMVAHVTAKSALGVDNSIIDKPAILIPDKCCQEFVKHVGPREVELPQFF